MSDRDRGAFCIIGAGFGMSSQNLSGEETDFRWRRPPPPPPPRFPRWRLIVVAALAALSIGAWLLDSLDQNPEHRSLVDANPAEQHVIERVSGSVEGASDKAEVHPEVYEGPVIPAVRPAPAERRVEAMVTPPVESAATERKSERPSSATAVNRPVHRPKKATVARSRSPTADQAFFWPFGRGWF